MGKIFVCCFVLMMFLGCANGVERIKTIVDDPASLLQDPHFAAYQKAMDDLEREYLQKKITYAEYLEKKKQLEEDYTKEVQERENGIESFR